MIAIVDLNLGNLFNVYRAFSHIGKDVIITDSAENIMAADMLVLSGVGSFKAGMSSMHEKN